jgi:hypothetical protein
MLFKVHVVNEQQFDAHVRALKAEGHIGAPLGGVNSRTVAGLESSSKGGGA